MSAALTVDALEGGYGRLTVFRDARLRLEAGQTIGLLGANGAGKTTLMKTIAGALTATAGRVLLGERDITRLKAFERARAGVALVPEGRHILSTLTVHDNLALTRAIEGHRTHLPPFEERIAEVFALFPGCGKGKPSLAARSRAASSRCSPSRVRCSSSHRC